VVDDSELIVYSGEQGIPYSKGLMAQSLMASGVSPERAYVVAAAVGRELGRAGDASVTLERLETIARGALGDDEGRKLVARMRQWQTLSRLDRPLIILIGGATGVGKSTLATQLAHRLGITRVASTDTVRQVMRAFFAADLMPEIHCASFEARDSVRIPLPKTTDFDKAGFIDQTKSVAVGVNAIIERAVTEGQRTIVEGVHVVPGFLDRSRWGHALVLEFVLEVSDRDHHRSHFYAREWETDGVRAMRHYLRNLPRIRKIQKYIVAQAVKENVTIIDNDNIDVTVKTVMEHVLDAVGDERRPAVRSIGR
jgi:2-phosphoglycerate kinase